jgi:Fe-S-cluster-containing dehydrogenase component
MKLPACVQTCQDIGAGALVFGDLNDPQSEVARLVAERSTKRIREDWGTEPKVYYIGL